MKSIARNLRAAITMVATVLMAAIPASATFPGKNGRIAFVSGADIYTMDADGTDVRQLTDLGPDNAAFWQSWSPDGKQIVFTEFRAPDYNGQIWIMNADGTNQHLLLAEPGFTEEGPSFSPDGKTIIFSRGYNVLPETGLPLIVQLYRIGVDGTGLTQVTTHTTLGVHDYWPKYSPDGKSILFQGDTHGGIIAAAYVADADGRKVRQVTPSSAAAFFPDWSPDGKKIAFFAHCCNAQNQTIGVINIDETGFRELTHNGTYIHPGPHDFSPSWSPEGDAIVFERWAPDFSSSAIVVMKSDGSRLTQSLTLPTSKVRAYASGRGVRDAIGSFTKSNHPRRIEEGGRLPRWGPVTE